MAEIVNVGTAPNTGTGDTLRAAMMKVNARFVQFEGNVDLNQRFYGAAAADPLTRPGGAASANGDWYYNTGANRYKVRVAGAWTLAPDIVASDFAVASGADNVGFGAATPNAILSNVGEKLRESVSIGGFGGKDDFDGTTPVTNSLSAFTKIVSDYPNGCRIRLPKTGTGRYYMSGNAAYADLAQYVIDPDPGVSVHYVGAGCPLVAPGLVVTRPLYIRMATQGYNFSLSPNAYGDVTGKPRWMSAGDAEAPIVENVSPIASLQMNAVSLSTGARSPATSVSDATVISFGSVSPSGFTVGTAAVRPGHELHAQVSMPGMTGSMCAYVETENGWVMFSQSVAGGDLTRRIFESGFAIQSSTFAYPLQEAQPYWFVYAEIGIRVNSPRSFSVLANHIEVARIDNVPSNIVRAGWGVGLVNSTNTAYIVTPARLRHKKTTGRRQIGVVVAGDSISATANPFSWVNHFRRDIAGLAGTQVKTLLNLAVPGHTSVQQRNSFVTQNLTGYDFALIAVGANDIGGGTTSDAFATAVEDMVNHCISYNVKPIVALPTMFYLAADAAAYGQTGQATANAVNGAPYRLKLLRKLADLGVQVNLMQMEDTGAIVPSLLGNSAVNAVVQDNIHPTAFGGEAIGWAWAKAVAGAIISPVRKDTALKTIPAGWIPSAIAASYGTLAKPSFQVVGDMFCMSDFMDSPAPVPNGTLILTLPGAYSPTRALVTTMACADNTGTPNRMCNVQIGTDGGVRVFAVPADSRYFYFGALQYPLAS